MNLKKWSVVINLFSIASVSFASGKPILKPKVPPGGYVIFLNDKYETLKVKKKNNRIFSENCAQDCAAEKALLVKKPFPKPVHSAMQNPAAQYCGAVGGKNLLAVNERGGEENFCRFNDNTFVNSWDLFYSRFPKEAQ